MNCHDATARFSDLRDGHLSGDELAEVERHVTNCPVCRTEWVYFREAVEALHGLGSVEPSPGFAARVRAKIEAPPWHRRLARRLFIPWEIKLPLEAAALVLVAIGITVIYQRSPEMGQGVERPQVSRPPAQIETRQRDGTKLKRPAFREEERGARQPQVTPLTKGVTGPLRDDALGQARTDQDQRSGSTVSEPTPPKESPAPALTSPREAGQPTPPAAALEAKPTERLESADSARPLSALARSAAPAPFRIITLRTRDVASAEDRIRAWIGLVGGRLLDPPAASAPTPSEQRTLSLIVPVRAVPRLDALLVELGQLLGREFDVPPSDEVLISLTLSPKMAAPSGSE